jgi:hypothetical protein
MRGYVGLQTLTGGVSPGARLQPETGEGDGATDGRLYLVNVTITDTSGPPAPLPGQPRPPQLGGGVAVPSYYINVQVTSQNPNTSSDVTVSQATYVSPN